MPDALFTAWNVLLMVIGFGFVIFVHELGHFLAARWARIRVPAFAIGFGNAVLSWRRGMGVRVGSTEALYRTRLREAGQDPDTGDLPGIGRTEYRLNWIPFGGYVKMLGQEDLNPGATSAQSGSYNTAPVWKRMVVISAGVVMNVLLAAVLFMAVFQVGLTETAPVLGHVRDGGPAAEAGLERGDVIRSVDGDRVRTFNDVFVAAAMAGRNDAIAIDAWRDGERVRVEATPRVLENGFGVLELGIERPRSLAILDRPKRRSDREAVRAGLERYGLGAVPFGSRLVRAGDAAIDEHRMPDDTAYTTFGDLETIAADADGDSLSLVFQPPANAEGEAALVETRIDLRPALERRTIEYDNGDDRPVEHLLGLLPPMRVSPDVPGDPKQGLRRGDVFLRIADVEHPSLATGIRAVRANAGRQIDVVVDRDGAPVTLEVLVTDEGTIGFWPDAGLDSGWLAAPLPESPAARLGLEAGARLVAVDGVPVERFGDLPGRLRQATRAAHATGAGATVTVALDEGGVRVERRWELAPAEVERLHALSHELPMAFATAFQDVQVEVVADGPFHAVGMGVHWTKRMLLMTYLTFKRLVDGTVKVEHVQGPVGIAHTGTRFAERGFVYLLFFLGLISANLAVVNFLPIPVVDGGQFLLLCAEGIRGRPVPIAVQNAATLAGLALIVAVFLTVTYNDIMRLLG